MFSGIQIFYFAFVAACGTCQGKAPPSADADRSPLKSPTGAFIAAQTRTFQNPFFTEENHKDTPGQHAELSGGVVL